MRPALGLSRASIEAPGNSHYARNDDRNDVGERCCRRTLIFLSFLRAAARSKASCIRSQVSGVLPNAFASLIAMFGLIPDLPFTTLFSACRVTPRTFAPSVTDSPKGSRQSCRTMRPGCTGFFIGMVCFLFSSVVIDQLNVKSVVPFETEDDAPVCSHGHGPKATKISFERVQAIARYVQALWPGGGIENRKDSLDRIYQIGPYPCPIAAFIKAFQASVLETSYHYIQSVK